MKRSGTTIVFVLVCAIVLVAAYGVGVCVREYRFRRAGVEPKTAAQVEKSVARPAAEGLAKAPAPAGAPEAPQGAPPSPGEGPGPGPAGDRMMGMRERFESMSEQERQEAMSRMRERVGGRRGGMPQLSEEDRAKMREEMDALRARWDQMSEEERQEAQAQMREKYGFAPRGFGGDRGPGGEGGRQRGSGPSTGQQEQ